MYVMDACKIEIKFCNENQGSRKNEYEYVVAVPAINTFQRHRKYPF